MTKAPPYPITRVTRIALDGSRLHQREKGHHIETLGVHFFWQSKTKLKRRKVMFGV
jgi:hypothetical protein